MNEAHESRTVTFADVLAAHRVAVERGELPPPDVYRVDEVPRVPEGVMRVPSSSEVYPAPEPERYALAIWHHELGAYKRAVLRMPESVMRQYLVTESVEDVPAIVTGAAGDFVRRIVEKGHP